eukprot:PhM_4_TR9498/c0_g1_i1/m.25892/K12830/SF3B3, SAP130, RSE1; splicing factor 3B subunit 3
MHLYNLTLQRPTTITAVAYGGFSARKAHEVVVVKGTSALVLYRIEDSQLHAIHIMDVFATVRAIAPVRMLGEQPDILAVTSDSGSLVFLEFDAAHNTWTRSHRTTYGKSGIRRIVPGEYVAVDPYGRCVMIAAIEKQKFMYTLSRVPGEQKLTVSSPMEAHKSSTVVFSVVPIDDGIGAAPTFASLEMEYASKPGVTTTKHVVYYEFDRGLHSVVRKWAAPVAPSANLLLEVPGGDGNAGPKGVLVCSENYIQWLHSDGRQPVVAVIPRRQELDTNHHVMIVCGACVKTKDSFLHLIQSEYGDIYKVTIDFDPSSLTVHDIKVRYFDTAPVSTSMVITRKGDLFMASETTGHRLYRIQSGGVDNDAYLRGMIKVEMGGAVESLPVFVPWQLRHMALKDELPNHAPVTDLKAWELEPGNTAVFGLGGRGTQGGLLNFKRELACSTLATKTLPAAPLRVWSIRNPSEMHDRHVILSYQNATLVMSMGRDHALMEVTDSGLSGDVETLAVGALFDGSLVQVQPNMILHISTGKKLLRWNATSRISCGTVNHRQIVVAMQGELRYFYLEDSGIVREVLNNKFDLKREIVAIELGPIPYGHQRSSYIAVATKDQRVYILNVDEPTQRYLDAAVPAVPSSLTFVYQTSDVSEARQALNLYIGLTNGAVQRRVLDEVSGQVSEPMTRMCGSVAVRTSAVKTADGSTAVVILSNTAWISFYTGTKYNLVPFMSETIDDVAGFSCEASPHGIITLKDRDMCVVQLPKLGGALDTFNISKVALTATPRRMARHPTEPVCMIIETDHYGKLDEDARWVRENIAEEGDPELNDAEFGRVLGERGQWASYLRLFDLKEQKHIDFVELDDNLAAFSVASMTAPDGNVYFVVGAVQDLVNQPRSYTSGFILTLRYPKLELIQKIPVDGIPYAISTYNNGSLLVGINRTLRLYALGRQGKLLKKCEKVDFPTFIVGINTMRDRIYVTDASESVHFVHYKPQRNVLATFADDIAPRWVTACVELDYNTVACGDKFGNFFVVRIPASVTEDADDDPGSETNPRWVWERGVLGGAPQRAEEIVQYHVGDMITSLCRTRLGPHGPEVILYGTIGGAVGCFAPLQKESEVRRLTRLEKLLRLYQPPAPKKYNDEGATSSTTTVEVSTHENAILGRDHVQYRSRYFPVRGVVDGDFLERFERLPPSAQAEIAEGVDCSASELRGILQGYRTKLL